MRKRVAEITSEILETITPSKEKRQKVEALASELRLKVASACVENGVKATVRVEGSVAKDTWLSGSPEIDIFMQLPTTIHRKKLGTIGLKIARKATAGSKQIERFAEHPYLEALIEDVRINVVPCYAVKKGEWLSATDRTPFHTDYLKTQLNNELRSEIRLLKRFTQGIGVYGAEIKIGGFSGYLCELLILQSKSFLETLHTLGKQRRMVMDIEGYYKGKEEEIQKRFTEPLIIIDPVDKARNVASAVRPQTFHTFVGATRAFLKAPGKIYFYPPPANPYSTEFLKKRFENDSRAIIFLTCPAIEAVPDVLWGQLYKTQRVLRRILQFSDFKVLRDGVWSNEKTLIVFILELEQCILPATKKHKGPPLTRRLECEDFLSKYAVGNNAVVTGPYIEDGRWIVHLKRQIRDASELLRNTLKKGEKDTGIAELVSQALKVEFEVSENNKISKIYRNNKAFAEFLTAFLKGKPFWLEPPNSKAGKVGT